MVGHDIVIVIAVVIGVVELAFVVWALIDVARRPVTALLPRWAWVIAILFFNLVGSVLYLVLGRSLPPRALDQRVRDGDRDERMRDAVATLYEAEQPVAHNAETNDTATHDAETYRGETRDHGTRDEPR